MAIVTMKRVHLYSLIDYQDQLLAVLQQFSGLELTALFRPEIRRQYPELLSPASNIESRDLESRLTGVEFCIDLITQYSPSSGSIQKWLRHKPTFTYSECRDEVEKSNWESTWKDVNNADETLRRLASEGAKLLAEIDALQPWIPLDISTEDLQSLRLVHGALGSLLTFFLQSLTQTLCDQLPDAELLVIRQEKDETLLLILCHHQDQPLLHTLLADHQWTRSVLHFQQPPGRMIQEHRDRLERLEQLRQQMIEGIAAHRENLADLQLVRDYLSTELVKARAKEQLAQTHRVLLAEGWVTADQVPELEHLIDEVCGDAATLELEDPSEEDEVPTLLRNNRFAEAFEPVTAMYSVPSYFETDPTPVYAPFMFVFFGMMLSDVAYGLLLSIGCHWALKRLDLTDQRRKFVRLFFYLGISAAFFGILYGSFFGDLLASFLGPLWIDPSANPMSVLTVAIAMGVVHLFVGLGVRAHNLIRSGHTTDALMDVGFWYLTLAGALLLFLGYPMPGRWLTAGGAIGLVVTQGRENKTLLGKLSGGFFGLYGITGYLGDVLSYSRLLALGLATGLIGSSFNLLANLIGFRPLVILFSLIIFVGGHTFNLLINILGAYVHAVRLQYLEFFSKFYSGGGKAFSPFTCETKYVHLIRQEVSSHGND